MRADTDPSLYDPITSIEDSDDPTFVAVHSHIVSPILSQEIVLISGVAWTLWLDDYRDIIKARKGPDASRATTP